MDDVELVDDVSLVDDVELVQDVELVEEVALVEDVFVVEEDNEDDAVVDVASISDDVAGEPVGRNELACHGVSESCKSLVVEIKFGATLAAVEALKFNVPKPPFWQATSPTMIATAESSSSITSFWLSSALAGVTVVAIRSTANNWRG